ncbi:hypothetical protein PHO31112_03268 [Pandoraea horticolens]|uniref:Uncharacterized protein n=1 Tax=Pandoraea horticolens TaxID=2508298 RepID=A0A5E4WGK4_9BURK|nr:hypothetical protein [Pandoraea horticolens]VVE23748.1 hypothetical protein PHO31112_03268 [Pandoraea horticolens]
MIVPTATPPQGPRIAAGAASHEGSAHRTNGSQSGMAANIRAVFCSVGQSFASKLGQARDFVRNIPGNFQHAVRSVFQFGTAETNQPQSSSTVDELRTDLAFATQASMMASGSAIIEHGHAPLPRELSAAVHNMLNVLEPGFFDRQPRRVKDATERLKPLADKRQLTRQDLLTLIDATNTLRHLPPPMQDRFSPTQRASIKQLERTTHQFLGPTTALLASLERLSADLEAKQRVPDIIEYLKEHRPDMLELDPALGDYRLNETGMRDYAGVKRVFDMRTKKRHMIEPNEKNMTDHEKNVSKLISNGYARYQNALRAPDDRFETKKTLIEFAQILESLVQAKPERVRLERYASVFPGGIAHPDMLVQGREYTEPGIVFVGGERPADKGYRMIIKLTKGFPVDARAFYGHHRGDDEKLQWLTLPGAKFRFDRCEEGRLEKYTTYHFTQIER